MSDVLDQIAEAIVAYLPSQSYDDLAVTADNISKRYTAIRSVDDLVGGYQIVVIPALEEKQPLGRNARTCATLRNWTVSVLVQGKVDSEVDPVIGKYRRLAEEIDRHLEGVAMAAKTWVGSETQVVADEETLTANNVLITENRQQYRGNL